MLKELPCYKPSKWYSEDGFFDLSGFPTEGIKEQVYMFLMDRAKRMAYSTLANERRAVLELAGFMAAGYPSLEDIRLIDPEVMERDLKKYLISEEKAIFRKVKSQYKNEACRNRQSIILLRLLFDFVNTSREDIPEEKKDIWELEKFNFPTMQNPTHMIRILSFRKIHNERMKEEIKRACFVRLHYNKVRTVQDYIKEGRYLVEFLTKEYPEITSLTELDRWVIEDYFLYRRTEQSKRLFACGSVSSLKTLLREVGKIYDVPILTRLILNLDYPKDPVYLYRAFSDAELERIHAAIRTLPKQNARCLFIHELLGSRISDTLTLKQDCLTVEDGRWIVRIDQEKTGKSYRKAVNEDTALLIQASIAWTNETYGKCEYVFVKKSNPSLPMPYSTIQTAFKRCLYKNHVKDDNGNTMKAKTHTFRKTYGQKLTDMGADDEVIARLLGHTCKSSVRYYRKMSPKALAEATKEYREEMDRLIRKYKKDWGYE